MAHPTTVRVRSTTGTAPLEFSPYRHGTSTVSNEFGAGQEYDRGDLLVAAVSQFRAWGRLSASEIETLARILQVPAASIVPTRAVAGEGGAL